MDDTRVGAAFRAVRIRRRWRQEDVAARSGVSRATVSLIERGHFEQTSLRTLRQVARTLEVRLDVVARWRGGQLDHMLSLRHSLLSESVVASFRGRPDWRIVPEVSFSIWGERGVIDLLAYHPPTGSLLVIELKTSIVDVNELVGTVDRKVRLAPSIASERGWHTRTVSRWVVVVRSKTNERRLAAHRSMLRAAFPSDGRAIRSWLASPTGTMAVLSTWTDAGPTSARPTTIVHP